MIPTWLSLVCAAFVIVWGAYRIKLGLRSRAAEQKALEKRGLYGLPRRTHILIGIIYVMLGVGLIAVSQGWNPMAGARQTAPAEPAKTPGGIQIELERSGTPDSAQDAGV